MQGAQTASRHRGIGRYTLSLAQAVARNRGDHEVILALNGLFPDSIETIRTAFDGLLHQENIRVWSSPGPVREYQSGFEWRREVAERTREAFLASLRPDVVHVSSLFEGYVDDAVTSIGVFATHLPTVVTLYDLIPLLGADTYLTPNPQYARYYHRKIESLKRANRCVAISESAAREGREALGLGAETVISISTASDIIFRRLEITDAERREFLERFGISQPFILYSGGADSRKNLRRLLFAYGQLPRPLADAHQLVLAGTMPQGEVDMLSQLANSTGIDKSQLRFTGYLTDEELVWLNNLCMVFVYPSLHEGFGLPALEAMACGAPTIGSNSTSVPEVIGREDALFDPYDEDAISRKMAQVLSDKTFRCELARHGREQAKSFSWDKSARRAIDVFERLNTERELPKTAIHTLIDRPKLAFVSPLPPERTGIADFSAELLPELARHYDIEVVVAQDQVIHRWAQANGVLRDSQWLMANAHRVDRVLYHVGNSPFHQHMLDLVKVVPGTIVLHDYFLSSLLAYLEEYDIVQHAWTLALYHGHGYPAVRERYRAGVVSDVKMKYPANLDVIRHAQGVIVHSEYSHSLAAALYGKNFVADWKVIPLMRAPAEDYDRAQSRAILQLPADAFVICSFGFLDPTKLNHLLLEAWLASRLANDIHCVLVFVGENHGAEYGRQLLEIMRTRGSATRIRITGWADMATFRNYLAAADIAVQLRTNSRGETSAAVLDCMNYGLPTIVNANGAMAEIPADAVWMLPDEFEQRQLVEALETLWQYDNRRAALGTLAKQVISTRHAPRACAQRYADTIEEFHAMAQSGTHALIKAIAALDSHQLTDAECRDISRAIANSLPAKQPDRQLLLDVSATSRNDLRTGIERVARALVMALLDAPPENYRVEPVYLTNQEGVWSYKYARRYALELLECPRDALLDELVEVRNGDILLGLDLSGSTLIEAAAAGLFTEYQNAGVTVHFVVYDLLPVQLPEYFPPGADEDHMRWLRAVARFDSAICISKAVANDLAGWLETSGLPRRRTFKIDWFHLGADIDNSSPTRDLPLDMDQTLALISVRPTFLMVGTIEPRKGYLQTLAAFTRLWRDGLDINLVIVGKEGWKGLPDEMRRTIPEIVNRLRNHPELAKHLFWLEGISDAYLEKVYAACTCLIVASEGEGFGLPLIEAAQRGLPILVRDIPVFREVAGEHAFYFDGLDPQSLEDALGTWLLLDAEGVAPRSDNTPWLTWRQSLEQLLATILPTMYPEAGAMSGPSEFQVA